MIFLRVQTRDDQGRHESPCKGTKRWTGDEGWCQPWLRNATLAAADKLHDNMEPSDYKHAAPGLVIFLNYIPDAFKAMRATLPGKDADDAMLVIKAGHISFKGMLPKEYVNSVEGDYGEPFEGRMQELAAALHEQQAAGATPGGAIAVNLQAQGLGDECG